MQKKLIFISGTIGTGKTTLSKKLVNSIPDSVMLDGDWCFQQGVNWHFDDDTKQMAINNIIHILNNYLANPNFECIIFCWTLHRQEIIDQILNSIDYRNDIDFYHFSLMCDENTLRNRIVTRFEQRKNELGIPYEYYDVQKMLLGAIKKMPFYFTNDAIKLDGNNDLQILYNEVIGNINSKAKGLKN